MQAPRRLGTGGDCAERLRGSYSGPSPPVRVQLVSWRNLFFRSVARQSRPGDGRMHDPFGRVRGIPRSLSRAGRVELIGEACEALLEGREPHREGATLLAAAVLGWLDSGDGDLARDYLRITAARGSHGTPAALWARAKRERSSSMSDTAQEAGQSQPSKQRRDDT